MKPANTIGANSRAVFAPARYSTPSPRRSALTDVKTSACLAELHAIRKPVVDAAGGGADGELLEREVLVVSDEHLRAPGEDLCTVGGLAAVRAANVAGCSATTVSLASMCSRGTPRARTSAV